MKLLQERAAEKLIPLTLQPFEKLSQRERAKVARIGEQLKIKQTGPTGPLLLVVAISPLFYMNVEKMRYTYMPVPKVRSRMKEEDIKLQLLDTVARLQQMIGVPQKFRNLFTKQGRKVKTVYELLSGEVTFFLGSSNRFANERELGSEGAARFFREVLADDCR